MSIRIQLLTFVFSIFCVAVQAQTKGVVMDGSNRQVIDYATVALLNPKDSSLVEATTTGQDGTFALKNQLGKRLLRVSYLGYRTAVLQPSEWVESGVVLLHRDSVNLSEVVVTGKMFQPTKGGILANVAGTVLEKLGTASDVIMQIPLVSVKKGEWEVLGRGKAVVYINNREVRDLSELDQINSNEVKQVKVITAPGAEFRAAEGAVIRIITSRPKGEGWSFQTSDYIMQERKTGHGMSVNVNYRRKGWDLFSSLGYDRTRRTYDQRDIVDYDHRQLLDSVTVHNPMTDMVGKIGTNYQWKEKASAGVYYRYSGSLSDRFEVENRFSMTSPGSNYGMENRDLRTSSPESHSVNGYAEYRLPGNAYLKLDADYVHRTNTEKQDFVSASGNLHNQNENKSNLYAGRLIYGQALWKGMMKSGAELSYTRSMQSYHLLGSTTLPNELRNNENEAKQHFQALFLQYEHNLGKHWGVSLGVRYEHAQFDYFLGGMKDESVSRSYHGLYPTASLSFNHGDFHAALSYRSLTNRPSYFSLRNSVALNNIYTYEGGNPKLQPERVNRLSLDLYWRDMQLSTTFQQKSDEISFVADRYESSDSIIFFHPVNFNKTRYLTVSYAYSPTLFKVWTPKLQVGMIKDFVSYGGRNYNKPYFWVMVKNIVKLPNDYLLGCDMSYSSDGYRFSIGRGKSFFYAGVYAIKSFCHDQLRLKLSCNNVFNVVKDQYSCDMKDISVFKWTNEDRRSLLFSVSYRFNPVKNKYRGEASSGEIRRL